MSSDPRLGNRTILTSAVLYAVAFLLTTILHESAHFVVAGALGRHPILFHSSVASDEIGTSATVLTKLAGPLFSAVQGVILLAVERRIRHFPPHFRLLIAWLAFHGWMNATGYLFSAAFAPVGDIGSILRLLELPWWVSLAVSGIGFWTIRASVGLLYPSFAALLPVETRNDTATRNRALIRLAVLAWPIGVVLVLPSSWPFPAWISAFYVVIAGIGAVWFTEFSKRGAAVPPCEPVPDTLPWWPAVALGLLTALNLTILRHGVPFPW